jgi:hypothetical protein
MSIETVDKGPRTVSRRAVVDAPAAELFAMLADPHRHHEVDGSGSVKADVKGPHALALGDRFTVAMKMFGAPYTMTSKVIALEPDRLIEWKHPARHTWRWEFREVSPDVTEITETWDATKAKAWPLYRVLGMVGRNEKGIESTLEGLQRRYR